MRLHPVLASCCGVAILAGAAAADSALQWPYDPSLASPFGAPNPAQTDPQARIFDPMIGVQDCTQQRINQQTGETTQSGAIWTWYYDMNGYGVRDVFRYANGSPASQRVYDPENKEWHVWYFAGHGYFFAGEWVGGSQDDRIVLEMDMEEEGRALISRLEFRDITKDGFTWSSANIDKATGEEFVDWTISCVKRQ